MCQNVELIAQPTKRCQRLLVTGGDLLESLGEQLFLLLGINHLRRQFFFAALQLLGQ